jgi:hypothetical protein
MLRLLYKHNRQVQPSDNIQNTHLDGTFHPDEAGLLTSWVLQQSSVGFETILATTFCSFLRGWKCQAWDRDTSTVRNKMCNVPI